ncbi:MAG: signal recognition particle-docking protein FtsY [Bacteroidales bacterium]|jgi:fused signal recognition particle receptor|nr:signal recognition particle-docking protein FtsY [Bacteroidales bacterium]
MAIFDIFKKKNDNSNLDLPKEAVNAGLEKTKKGFFSNLSRAVFGKSKVSDILLDDLEEALVMSDVGIETTLKIIDRVEKRVAKEHYRNADEFNQILKEEIAVLLGEKDNGNFDDWQIDKTKTPYVIMVVGVNGVGKTTTIGKMAYQFKQAGLSVMLSAADTFRAAAVDQLRIWSERVGVPIVMQQMGSDPSSVAFDTLKSAVAKNIDVVIIDTAGRLHNKINLMNELSKIKNVMKKIVPEAPHEILLVLDASIGQNSIEQAKQFGKMTQITALALTKLDGTAKGGVVIGISDSLNIPIKYIGMGEKMTDLKRFNRIDFVNALFE